MLRNKLKAQVDYLAKQAVRNGTKAAGKAMVNAAKTTAKAAAKAAQAAAKAVANAVSKVAIQNLPVMKQRLSVKSK